jgi:hypothetical protein
LPKTGFVFHSDVGEDFPVEFNSSGFEPMYESTIGESVQSGGGVNSYDPQSSKIAFSCAPVCVGVVPSLLYRFCSSAFEIIPTTAVTFRMLKHPTTAFTSHTPCFYSCHLRKTPITIIGITDDRVHYFARVCISQVSGHSILSMNKAFQAFLIARIDKG